MPEVSLQRVKKKWYTLLLLEEKYSTVSQIDMNEAIFTLTYM